MLHLISNNTLPLRHISSGHFFSDGGFVHQKRNINVFVLIFIIKGVLNIEQDGISHQVKSNEYILLFPGLLHFGTEHSIGELSYYWCHFQIQNNNYSLVDRTTIRRHIHMIKENTIATSDNYLMPEFGMLEQNERVIMLFRQLLDAARRKSHSEYLSNYALSVLVMEISTNFVSGYDIGAGSSTYKHITEIMEWIRINYNLNLSVVNVAETFNYNPNYLSGAFKKYVGCSLLDYINRMRINIAKKMLLSEDESIRMISAKVGFADEKYFMKVFKKLEGVTPSQYKNAFYRKRMNK